MKNRYAVAPSGKDRFSTLRQKIYNQRQLLLLCVPAIIVIGIFSYGPIYGVLIAFKDYKASLGVTASPWEDPLFKNFILFFKNPKSLELLKNTVVLGVTTMLFSFPAPIIFAMLLNELKNGIFKKTVQTISYIPHFITVVVVVGMIYNFSSIDGIFNVIGGWFGAEPKALTNGSEHFLLLYVGSALWQGVGYSSIIYLSAIAGVDPTLYDVANIDGANRWHKMKIITWPTIRPTTVILLIMNMGNVLGADFQKVILMQNDTNRSAVDVISSYVYREGILGARFEYTTAVNLFLSVISFVLVFAANKVTQKIDSENSLW